MWVDARDPYDPQSARFVASDRAVEVTMVVTLLGTFLGLVLGFAMAGPAGGTIGAVGGAVIGMLWAGAIGATARVPMPAHLVREQHALLCEPKGQVATATFLRDAVTNRWLDVERCTLCEPADQVGCNKRCLVLMRDVLPPRKHPAVPPATQAV
jgi:hypothetical protein